MHDWQDKVALVTGASRGLGKSLAVALAKKGVRVAILARGSEALEQVRQSIEAAGGRALAIPCDITQDDQVHSAVEQIIAEWGRLDVVANVAGRSARAAIENTSPEMFQELWELNFLAAVRTTLAAMPHLVARQGHVINIGSLASKTASRYLGAYPASKFALAAWSQQLRLELADQGLHVLLVCPGPIRRADAGGRYDEQASDLPESARKPGGGVQLKGIDPDLLAAQIIKACEKRKPELVLPTRARLLFAVSALWPSLGDRLIKRMT